MKASADQPNPKVKELAGRVEALESALANIASAEQTGTTSGSSAATAAIGASVQALSKRVSELEADLSAVAALETRLGEVEATARATPPAEKKAAVVLAVGQLGAAVTASVPFKPELDALKAIAGDDAAMAEAIAVLEPQADSGTPSLTELRAAFPAVVTEVTRVQADWTGESWVDTAINRVTSLVSIRKTGADAVAAEGVDGAVAQAESALINGDVAAAVKALEGLEGPPAEAAAPWLAEANKRLAAEAALTNLRQRAIALLASGG